MRVLFASGFPCRFIAFGKQNVIFPLAALRICLKTLLNTPMHWSFSPPKLRDFWPLSLRKRAGEKPWLKPRLNINFTLSIYLLTYMGVFDVVKPRAACSDGFADHCILVKKKKTSSQILILVWMQESIGKLGNAPIELDFFLLDLKSNCRSGIRVPVTITKSLQNIRLIV